jgi:hypothetical protein
LWIQACFQLGFDTVNLRRPALRLVPTASISSMKIMHGVFFFAAANQGLTLVNFSAQRKHFL